MQHRGTRLCFFFVPKYYPPLFLMSYCFLCACARLAGATWAVRNSTRGLRYTWAKWHPDPLRI